MQNVLLWGQDGDHRRDSTGAAARGSEFLRVTLRAAHPHCPSAKANNQTTSPPSSPTVWFFLCPGLQPSRPGIPHKVNRIGPPAHSDRVSADVMGLGRTLLVPICSRNVECFERNLFPSHSLTLSQRHSVWANGDLKLP